VPALFADEPDRSIYSLNGWRRPSGTSRSQQPMIDVEVATTRPRVDMRLSSDKEILPLVRQALRAVADSAGAPPGTLQDAELALTEASANAVRHAYRNGDGVIEVTIEARQSELIAVVRDRGRGMHGSWRDHARRGGLGLTVIESVAHDLEIRTERGVGTEVAMALAGPDTALLDDAALGAATGEQVVRRFVAMTCAQADLSPAQVSEAQHAAELIARHAATHLVADRLRARIHSRGRDIELRVGPLVAGGAAATLRDADVPPLGSVIERFADRVWIVSATADEGEQLAVRFVA
jgi:serine/threonine-protein kinase RsbW